VARRRRRRPIEVELTPIDGPAIHDVASMIADRELLDSVLRKLDPEWRAVIVMHYFLGIPLQEVAATLGVPLGTVKSRLHRSLSAMRIAITIDELGPRTVVSGEQAS
jgi:RNA polymerase sigma-70 factor (ECF subfamily)